jgi:hypothetical protein
MSIIGIIIWGDLKEEKLCFLAKSTGLSNLIFSTYILFFAEIQKGKPRKMDLPY